MHRFKIAITPVVSVLVLGLSSGPVLAKRRHPRAAAAAPAAETAPATEVEVDPASRAVVPSANAEPANDAVAPKGINVAPAPAVVEAPREPRAAAMQEPAENAIRRGRSTSDEALGASRLTAHVGVGAPLVTLQASRTTSHVGSLKEDFTLVAPLGLGLLLTDHWTFDFEFQVSTGVRPEGLTTAIVDPGMIYTWDRLAAGLRVAWQLNENQNVGLIPLMRVLVLRNERANWFVEVALPSFVQNKQITASASLQTGVGF
jgi:hypothetical protein